MAEKKKNRFPGVLLAMAMCLGLLSGCGMFGSKAPTAQELMDGAAEGGKSGYMDMDMSLKASGESDGQQVALTFTAGVEASGDVAHVYDGTMSVSMAGFSMEFGMEAWTDQKANTGYVNMSLMGESSGWTKSSMDSGTASIGEMAGTSWMTEGAGEYTLQDHKKGEDWVVTFRVSSDKLAGAMGEVTESEITGDLDVEARFDEKTHELKSVTAGCDADGMRIDMAITVKSRSDKSLAVPQDVIDSAIDSGMDDDFGGWDDDGGYGGDAWEANQEGAWIEDDGDGEDALMAQIAQNILNTGMATGSIDIWHYSTETEVNWDVYDEAKDFSIRASMTHITDTEYGGASDAYKHEVGFVADYFGDDGKLYTGGANEGQAAYIRRTGYSAELDYVKVYPEQECYVTVDVYSYEDGVTDAALWEILQDFLTAHGM